MNGHAVRISVIMMSNMLSRTWSWKVSWFDLLGLYGENEANL
jgi:hypothetical protein